MRVRCGYLIFKSKIKGWKIDINLQSGARVRVNEASIFSSINLDLFSLKIS